MSRLLLFAFMGNIAIAHLQLQAQSVAPTPALKTAVETPSIHKAVRLKAAGQVIATENPGYASPAWFDVNQDGLNDLIVGQFAGGKMKVYEQAKDGSFGKGAWIKAGQKPAKIPGVW